MIDYTPCIWYRVARDHAWHRSPEVGWEQACREAEHAAQRIDNLGRALSGAAMLATVERRAEERAYAIARQSLNWRRP